MEFYLHNVTRARHTRAARIASPTRVRHTQYVLDVQHRLIPGRPLVIDGETLLRNMEQVKDLVEQQIVEVRTCDDKLVDLETFKPIPGLPPPPAPNVLLDDANNDIPQGQEFAALIPPKEVAAGAPAEEPSAPIQVAAEKPIPAAPTGDPAIDFSAAFEGATVEGDAETEPELEEEGDVTTPTSTTPAQQQHFGKKHKKHRR